MSGEPVVASPGTRAPGFPRRYRLPRSLGWVAAAFAALNIIGTVSQAGRHQALTHSVPAVMFTVMSLVVLLVPMTTVTSTEIRRWWSAQRSRVPWADVQDIEARTVRKQQTTVYARLREGDQLLLLGVSPKAVPELRRLAGHDAATDVAPAPSAKAPARQRLGKAITLLLLLPAIAVALYFNLNTRPHIAGAKGTAAALADAKIGCFNTYRLSTPGGGSEQIQCPGGIKIQTFVDKQDRNAWLDRTSPATGTVVLRKMTTVSCPSLSVARRVAAVLGGTVR